MVFILRRGPEYCFIWSCNSDNEIYSWHQGFKSSEYSSHIYNTNYDLCRILGHATQAKAGCHQTIKAPSMTCGGVAGPWTYSLPFMPQELWNWHIKWMKSVTMGGYQYKNQVNGEFFVYLWVILLYFSIESKLIPAVLELSHARFFWKND